MKDVNRIPALVYLQTWADGSICKESVVTGLKQHAMNLRQQRLRVSANVGPVIEYEYSHQYLGET
jgi:hypothetical protein